MAVLSWHGFKARPLTLCTWDYWHNLLVQICKLCSSKTPRALGCPDERPSWRHCLLHPLHSCKRLCFWESYVERTATQKSNQRRRLNLRSISLCHRDYFLTASLQEALRFLEGKARSVSKLRFTFLTARCELRRTVYYLLSGLSISRLLH